MPVIRAHNAGAFYHSAFKEQTNAIKAPRYFNWSISSDGNYVYHFIWNASRFLLTVYWDRVTSICFNKLPEGQSCIKIGLSPGRLQAAVWTNIRILLIGLQGTNVKEMSIEIRWQNDSNFVSDSIYQCKLLTHNKVSLFTWAIYIKCNAFYVQFVIIAEQTFYIIWLQNKTADKIADIDIRLFNVKK